MTFFFLDMWNNLSTKNNNKTQDQPLQDGEIWIMHFDNIWKPSNQLNDNYYLIKINLHTSEATIKIHFPITQFDKQTLKPKMSEIVWSS